MCRSGVVVWASSGQRSAVSGQPGCGGCEWRGDGRCGVPLRWFVRLYTGARRNQAGCWRLAAGSRSAAAVADFARGELCRSVVAVWASSGQRPAASLVVPGVNGVVMGVEECHCQMGRGEMRRSVVAVWASSCQLPAASPVVPGVNGVVMGVMECHCTGSFVSTHERAATRLAAGDWPLVAVVPPPLPTSPDGSR